MEMNAEQLMALLGQRQPKSEREQADETLAKLLEANNNKSNLLLNEEEATDEDYMNVVFKSVYFSTKMLEEQNKEQAEEQQMKKQQQSELPAPSNEDEEYLFEASGKIMDEWKKSIGFDEQYAAQFRKGMELIFEKLGVDPSKLEDSE